MVRRTVHVLALLLAVVGLLVAPGAYAQTSNAIRVVESGDTLWQIAQDASTDVASLLKLNGLDDGDVIVVGQSLKLPSGSASASGSASGSAGGAAAGRSAPASGVVSAGASPVAAAVRKYTVADGDTLARGPDAQRYLDRNDSYHYFDALGDLVRTGPTNTNVMDVRMVLVGGKK